ncbi:hypothetical protein EVAR_92566_1 [Eumeta japonica]|uniref:Uncharacterized protein n=1 Tax=Eumeta variegata TaxID=151549 RepID=A0A4C1SWL4_EUMVA|nr:hypothetical protein EVAR_92566_1 [Eumeta japonica]
MRATRNRFSTGRWDYLGHRPSGSLSYPRHELTFIPSVKIHASGNECFAAQSPQITITKQIDIHRNGWSRDKKRPTTPNPNDEVRRQRRPGEGPFRIHPKKRHTDTNKSRGVGRPAP